MNIRTVELSVSERDRLKLLEEFSVELRQMCAFLHSVIVCKEKWTDEDESKYRALVEP